MTALDTLTPSQDERIMAALAHASTLIPFMGVIAPIVIWATQKDKSKYVAFQAFQAIVYQATIILAGFIGMGCYMFSLFGSFITTLFLGLSDSNSAGPLFFLGLTIPFFVLGMYLVGQFIFYVYAVIGAIMALQGKPFRYVIIGRWVERVMQPAAIIRIKEENHAT